MVAGSVGVNCTSSENELAGGLVELDTISMESGWWILERKSQAVLDQEKVVLDEEKAARDRALQKRFDELLGRYPNLTRTT